MPTILIVGATRGLGAALANEYARNSSNTVYGTARSSSAPTDASLSKSINWIPGIDLLNSNVGARIVDGLTNSSVRGIDIVIITAGYFATEDFSHGPNWDAEVKMYSELPFLPPFPISSS